MIIRKLIIIIITLVLVYFVSIILSFIMTLFYFLFYFNMTKYYNCNLTFIYLFIYFDQNFLQEL